jgi:hypothetical protein
MFVTNQRMMGIYRHWQIQQGLKQSVDVSRFKQIGPSRNMRHTLKSIINHYTQMITATDISPNKYDVPQ